MDVRSEDRRPFPSIGTDPQSVRGRVEAMERLGAKVFVVDPGTDEADAGREAAERAGALFIEDGERPEIAAGAGTIAQELTAAGLKPDVVLVQIGDGALVTGMGSWLKANAAGTRVVGVTALGAPAMADSVAAGAPVARPAGRRRDLCPRVGRWAVYALPFRADLGGDQRRLVMGVAWRGRSAEGVPYTAECDALRTARPPGKILVRGTFEACVVHA